MDFYVNFTLDENFDESIKSRFRDDFSYASFSEGEKQKIDLALLFTWREIAKMKNSVSTNLLILDEVFDSSLDEGATQELLKILRGLGSDANLFVISHKGEILVDKFLRTAIVEKVNDFSKVRYDG
jgi:energy-coupling factor transporter ATP-binding protein EcfA2